MREIREKLARICCWDGGTCPKGCLSPSDCEPTDTSFEMADDTLAGLKLEGLAIVPVEPDSAQMNDGAIEMQHQSVQSHSLQHKASQIYKAMINTATREP